MESITATAEQLPSVATRIIDNLPITSVGATVLALHGNLGAGKTSITQAIADQLGVAETVTSPTFVIRKDYSITHTRWNQLVHIDAYRLESAAELEPLQFAELLQASGVLLIVEWGERIATALPESTLHLEISIRSDESRSIAPISHQAAARLVYE